MTLSPAPKGKGTKPTSRITTMREKRILKVKNQPQHIHVETAIVRKKPAEWESSSTDVEMALADKLEKSNYPLSMTCFLLTKIYESGWRSQVTTMLRTGARFSTVDGLLPHSMPRETNSLPRWKQKSAVDPQYLLEPKSIHHQCYPHPFLTKQVVALS